MNPATNTQLSTVLRKHGKSVTATRATLFTYLQQVGLVSIAQFLEDNKAVADRASLYRTLDLFKRLGVVDERISAGRRSIELTDVYDSHHHHLTCNYCGVSKAITAPEIEAALESICATQGFRVAKHVIEIDGCCQSCQQKQPNAVA